MLREGRLGMHRDRVRVLLGCFAFTYALQWAYRVSVAPRFEYMGYGYEAELGVVGTAIGLLAFVPVAWLPVRLVRPSELVDWVLYLVVVVPTAIVATHRPGASTRQAVALVGTLVCAHWLLVQRRRVPRLVVPRARTEWPLWAMLVVLGVGGHAVLILLSGVRSGFSVLSTVYDIRLEYRTAIHETGRLVGYIVPWLLNVVNPFMMLQGLRARNFFLATAGVVGQWIIFSVTGFKTALFSCLLLPALWVLLGKSSSFGTRIVWVLTAAIVLSVGGDVLTGAGFLASLLVRRLLLTPGLLTCYYFEFFSENPKALLGDSFLRGIVRYPYEEPLPFVIGLSYFGNPLTSANANVWANAFANFGYLGVLSFTAVLAVTLWVYDSAARRTDLRFAAAMLAMPSVALSNSALFTTLLTHGLGLLVVLMMLFVPESDLETKARRGKP